MGNVVTIEGKGKKIRKKDEEFKERKSEIVENLRRKGMDEDELGKKRRNLE